MRTQLSKYNIIISTYVQVYMHIYKCVYMVSLWLQAALAVVVGRTEVSCSNKYLYVRLFAMVIRSFVCIDFGT